MEINHFSHHHPLVLLDQETGTDQSPKHYCFRCEEAVEGSTYSCGKCRFFLHKKCAELAGEINHPLHHQHRLVLSFWPYAYSRRFSCNLCRESRQGFAYNCSSCKFDLDIRCATHPQLVAGDFQKLQHRSHDHPLIFVQHIDFGGKDQVCSGCERPMSSPFYCCPDCIFFLHKKCVELSLEITHHTHQKHPLFLLDKPPLHEEIYGKGFVYYCSICKFGIPISYTFAHEHPLVVVEETSTDESGKVYCSRCMEPVLDSSYSCSKCRFFIHKQCAELPLEVSHLFHLQHPLILHDNQWRKCNVCLKGNKFCYRCTSCEFNLDIKCAMHQHFVARDLQKLQHFSHDHPLIFVEDIHETERKEDVCSGCQEPMSTPFYCCPNCRFYLHRKCAETELPLEINHPSHRKHPLFRLAKSPPHQEKCSCYLCKKSYNGFVYYCSLCAFGFKAADAFLQTAIAKIHEHPLTPFLTTNPFTCNACGTGGHQYSFPYICSICSLMFHKDCVSLSRSIKITRHHHRLSHIYSLQEKEAKERECNICHDEVKMEYGSYCCSQCNYFAHVNCAIDKDLLEEEGEESKLSASDDSTGDISCAFTEIEPGKIKHFAHEHNLTFSDRGVKEGQSCEGCMRPIATSFYYCEDCDFFIHEGCAKLSKKVRHWASKYSMELFFYIIFRCTYCWSENSGFGYKCDGYKTMCIRCHEIPDTCTVERHEHPLFFDHKYEGSCCGCGFSLRGGFRCKDKKCKFVIDYRCLVLPSTGRYKYDNHPLTLTFRDDHHRSQCYCDICEEDRDPKYWFYHCADCDVSAHPDCVHQGSPYVKLGKPFRFAGLHQHLVTFVKIDFYPPKCNKCHKPCRDELAIQCTESDCNYIAHRDCLFYWNLLQTDL